MAGEEQNPLHAADTDMKDPEAAVARVPGGKAGAVAWKLPAAIGLLIGIVIGGLAVGVPLGVKLDNDECDVVPVVGDAPLSSPPPPAEMSPSPAPSVDDECDVDAVDLMDFEPWAREEGFWWGEYTFLSGTGDAFRSNSWNYPYDHYYGFIRMKVEGNKLQQRNIFVYPPAVQADCFGQKEIPNPMNPTETQTVLDVTGNGACGVNGNEKIFEANQVAVDCEGSLAGPFFSGGQRTETFTTLIGNDTILYRVQLPSAEFYEQSPFTAAFAPFGDRLIQNQLTTVLDHGERVRTAQGFNAFLPDGEIGNSASFYREHRVDTYEEWLAKLHEIRAEFNILEEDYCAWDATSNAVEAPNCYTHMMLSDIENATEEDIILGPRI